MNVCDLKSSITKAFVAVGFSAGLALAFPLSAIAQDETARPVKLMTVTAQGDRITRQFFGQVVARQTVDLAFQVSGQIVEFPVLEGQHLPKGSLIAQLDLEPFQLQYDQAQLRLEQVNRTLERFSKLTGTAVSQVAADDAKTDVGLARIALSNADYSLKHATLLAPFDALVAARNVANFTTISAGTHIVRLHDMSEVRVEIDVPEILFQQTGEEANVELFARFPISDELYPLEVREFDAEASAVGQTIRLTLGMDRPDGMNVLPGSSVTVVATLESEGALPVVPVTALRIANDGSTQAMVFDGADGDEGRVSLRSVTVQPDRDGAFQVTSGLAKGEVIVVTGVNALADGQAVRRFTGFAD